MKSALTLLVLVGLACASTNPAFKDNTEYVYLVNGRTLTSLFQLSDQYSGIYLKAKLHIISRPDGKLQARISDAQYAQLHSELPGGWDTQVPDSELSYKPVTLSDKPFQILVKDGLIKGLIVEKAITNWEANVIKSIVSQFQLDIKAQHIIPSPINILPKEDRWDRIFKTMEETITGKTETFYEIHPLPEYLFQTPGWKHWMVPQPKLKGDGHIVEVVKSKNYTNSDEAPAYHYGFGQLSEGDPTSNRMGKFFSRQSTSHAVLSGKPSRYTIQNSRTINKIIVNPTMNAKEQGLVVSYINVTLHEVKSQTEQIQELINPLEIGNLVYTYESPFAQSNEVRLKQVEQKLQQEYSEESSERSWQRFRRSSEQMIRKMEMDESSRSSSEETVQYQSRPTMSKAPESPLLPYYTGYYGRSIKAKVDLDLKQNVKRIAKEISEDLQAPEKILTHSTLSKYVMLCSLVRLMNEDEIRSVTEELYTQAKQGQERLTWVAWRDAVSAAGTGPAFLNIEQWIVSKKIEKDEAAEVVAAMSYAVRVPTEEYMLKFFEMIRKPEVRDQETLNETSLLLYTSLVNRVYTNVNKSHNEYPVHSFRNFNTKEGMELIKSTVIPFLSQQLEDAVSQADSRKIHVYIRALGNVGFRQILKAFEPYLEGEKQVSQFQRMLMVLSMDKLVTSYPVQARSVLYRIYQNIAEVPEVRVVAVYQLMRSDPPAEMVQRMAENTNTDPQEEVNAAVKSAIESISELPSAYSQKLRKAAETARPLLTKKQYGKHQSLNFLQEFITENMNSKLHHNFFQIGSTDSHLPKGIKYRIRGNVNGMKQYLFNIQAMVSSIKELTNVMSQQTKEYERRSQGGSGESKWSSAKIAESLNLQTNEREQLEGFIYTEMQYIQKLWSFDNETIKMLPQVIREREQMLKNGKKFSYTKLRQLKEMALSIPTEMGLPFLYTYDVPLLLQFEGKIKAVATPELSSNNKLQMPEQFSAEADGFVTASTKVQSHLSVVTPFDHQIYIAGFDKNVQAHLPIKAKVQVDVKNINAKIEFEVKEDHKDARLLHYSSWPYTSKSDITSLSPVALRPTTYLIRPQGNTHRAFDFVFGQKQTGMAFRVWGHHPQQSKNLLELARMLQFADISNVWQLVWDDFSMQQTEASIVLLPEQCTTRKIVLNLGYHKRYQREPQNQNEEEFFSMDQLSSKVEQQIEQRRQEMTKYVGAGIKSAKLHYMDASLEFQGDRKYQHTVVMAAAKSNVAPQSRFVVFYKMAAPQPLEFAFQVKSYIPNTNGLDLTYSLKTSPTAKYDVLVQQGESGQQSGKIRATIDLTRSDERKMHIEKQPLYTICKEQMQEGNRQLSACQNLTIESNYLDDIKVQLQYENLRKEHTDVVESIFKGVRFLYYPMTEIKTVQPEGQNKINVRVQFEQEKLRQVNVTVRTANEETKIFNLSLGEMAKTMFVPHPVFHLKARVLGKIMEQDNIRPTCVIDQKAAQTFSNLTFPLSLGNEWTLMMQYLPQQARLRGQAPQTPTEQLRDQLENFAVLVRELSAQQIEIKMIVSHPQTEGKTIEISMKPKDQSSVPAIVVMADGKELQFDDKQAANLFDGYIEVYSLPNGEVKIEVTDWFYVIFDGERVKLTATSDNLRDSIVGLCGRFSQDFYEDFWTPDNCIVRSPKKFIESFVVEGKNKQTKQKNQDCIPKVLPLYVDVISDRDAKIKGSQETQSTSGIKYRNRYVEQNGDICFTIHPVAVCKNLARTYTTKDIPVHCITKTKTAYYLKSQIDQGGNPDFTRKPVTKTVQMEIPDNCF